MRFLMYLVFIFFSLASENGHHENKPDEPATEEPAKEDDKQSSEEDTKQPESLEEVPETEKTEEPIAEPHEAGDAQDSAAEISVEDKIQELSKEESQPVEATLPLEEDVSNAEQDKPLSGAETTTYKMEVPNSKVCICEIFNFDF